MSAGAKHKLLLSKHPAPKRHAAAPFPLTFKFRVDKYRTKGEGIYPRAGVRVQPDGKWLLQIWYSVDVVRIDEDQLTHDTRRAAFTAGQHAVHAARTQKHPAGQSWLRLRGVAKAVMV